GSDRELHPSPARRSSDLPRGTYPGAILFVAGVIATAMSTIDSYLLIAGGNLAYDIYRPIAGGNIDDATLLRLTRYAVATASIVRSEEHTSELQSREKLVC